MDNPEQFPANDRPLDDDPFSLENGRFATPPSPQPLETEPLPKNRRSCWISGIALLVIFSLVASGLLNLLWAGGELVANWSPPWLTPTPSLAEAGRIAYVAGNGQIYTVQPDGENGRQLTDSRFPYQFPAWAAVGKQLAAIGNGNIMLMVDAEERSPRLLYEGNRQHPFYLYWSPDGSQLSFLSNSPQGMALRVLPMDGSSAAAVWGTGSPFYWNWLDDSRHMLVHTGMGSTEAQLGILQADGQLEEIAPPGSFQAPGVSANGRYWAYAEEREDDGSWLVVHDTENGEQWSERHPAVAALSWSPTADQLAFSTGLQNRNSFWGPLRLFDTKTEEVRLLSDNRVLAFFWSPNGRYLATINTGNFEQDFGINVADSYDSKRSPQAKTSSQLHPHQFNLAIIDVETGAETQLMRFFPTVIFIGQFLPFFDQYALSHSIWSPNSDALVLPIRQEGQSRVKVIRVDGSEVFDLGEGDMAFWSR